MKYDILKPSAPKMPSFGKGTESIKILLSQVSENMQEPLVPMLFPLLAHTSAAQNFSTRTTVDMHPYK